MDELLTIWEGRATETRQTYVFRVTDGSFNATDKSKLERLIECFKEEGVTSHRELSYKTKIRIAQSSITFLERLR